MICVAPGRLGNPKSRGGNESRSDVVKVLISGPGARKVRSSGHAVGSGN